MYTAPYKLSRQLFISGAFIGLLLFTACIYWPGLQGPLLLDDFTNLSPLKQLEGDPALWREIIQTNNSGPLGRPISMLSFAFNQITSGWNVWSFKYTNLTIHILCGTLVFWLAGRLLMATNTPYLWETALLVAALWLLSPLFVSTVLYVVQRMAQLATLFMLAGLLCYVIGRQGVNTRPAISIPLIASTFLIWTPLATFSKENGALLPFLALLLEAFFFRFQGPRSIKILTYVMYLTFLVIPLFAVATFVALHPDIISSSYEDRPFTLLQRLLTESRIVWDYALALTVPQGTSFGIYHDDYVLSKDIFHPISTFLSLIGVSFVVGWIVLSIPRRSKTLFFGLAFFLGAHLIESSIFPLELYFEHRNYLPGLGIYLTSALLLFSAAARFPRLRTILFIVAVLVPGIFAAATVNRVLVWQSLPTLLSFAATTHPSSVRVHTHIALYYAKQGKIDEALRHAHFVGDRRPQQKDAQSLFRFILYCTASASPPSSEYSYLESSLNGKASRNFQDNFRILTDRILDGNCTGLEIEKIISALKKWLSNRPHHDDWRTFALLAKLDAHQGDYRNAVINAELARTLNPGDPIPLMMSIYYYIQSGDSEKARSLLDLLQHPNGLYSITRSIRKIIEYYTQLLDARTSDRHSPSAIFDHEL